MNKKMKSLLIIVAVILAAALIFLIAQKVTEDPRNRAQLGIGTMAPGGEAASEGSRSADSSRAAAKPGETQAGASEQAAVPSSSVSQEQINQMMANLHITDRTGKVITLGDFAGKYVIVNYWASWCPPCKAEMPDLQKFYDEHKDEQDFVYIALNATGGRETKESADAYIKENAFTFPVYYDMNQEVGYSLGLQSLPSTFSVGPESQPGFFMQGMRTHEDFEQLLAKTREQFPLKQGSRQP